MWNLESGIHISILLNSKTLILHTCILHFPRLMHSFPVLAKYPKEQCFFGFYTILCDPHKNVKLGFYCGNEQTKNILTLLP